MDNIRDIFEFDSSCTDEFINEFQKTLDRLEQLITNSQDDLTIWEYARENSSDNLAYTIINLISANLSTECYNKVNELIYSLEDNNK